MKAIRERVKVQTRKSEWRDRLRTRWNAGRTGRLKDARTKGSRRGR